MEVLCLLPFMPSFQHSVNGIAKQFNAKFYGTVDRKPVAVELKRKYGDHELWNGLSVLPAGSSEGNVDISAIDVSNIDYEGQGGKIKFLEGETEKTIKVKKLGIKRKNPRRDLRYTFQIRTDLHSMAKTM
ncbi:hypothetical protein MKR81_26745 (plasmid) [Vibrio campbellii]|uniref:hypothetical protein n=1 Tax=Vibrio campbellii TaxID=680 RepID=UPI001F074665|nr:hypothetical protein [Vibrio campbellii]UMM06862.1 hypothetical protein MKR81_26745 [Vibrio campbellii]